MLKLDNRKQTKCIDLFIDNILPIILLIQIKHNRNERLQEKGLISTGPIKPVLAWTRPIRCVLVRINIDVTYSYTPDDQTTSCNRYLIASLFDTYLWIHVNNVDNTSSFDELGVNHVSEIKTQVRVLWTIFLTEHPLIWYSGRYFRLVELTINQDLMPG